MSHVSDPTTDPARRSFIEVEPDSHFSIQNLPYGIFRPSADQPPRVGVAIGRSVLDIAAIESAGLLEGTGAEGRDLFNAATLNPFMEAGPTVWRAARSRIDGLLDAGEPTLRDDEQLRALALLDADSVVFELPVAIGDYTDFYSSREHATNVGTMFRGPDNALMPNWLHLPVGYHGRASSIVLDGAPITRPSGQTRPDDSAPPVFGPSRLLDFELELGYFVGTPNALGEPIGVDNALDHIFGMVLVNDWSARDIQKWEYVPLGPFLAKNFATSISPWVVPMDALRPFFAPGYTQEPEPLPYLRGNGGAGVNEGIDMQLEVHLSSKAMRDADPDASMKISGTNAQYLYWSMAQQLAHHTVTGCNVRAGDLMASGTISGPEANQRGSLLEITWRGQERLMLPDGESRTFLEDGDELVLTGWCQGEGYRVGFGSVRGQITPAVSF